MNKQHIHLLSLECLETRVLLSATPVGSELLVGSPSNGLQTLDVNQASVATLAESGFVATYTGKGLGDRNGVYVRLFDDDGMAALSSTLVNQTTAGSQSSSAVASLPSGEFVVVWEGRGVGDRYGVFARWFDSNGVALTDEVHVNQTTGGIQQSPTVAVDTNGVTSIAWQGVGDGDFNGIFLRQFDSSGTAIDDELRVNENPEFEQAMPAIAVSSAGETLVTWSSRHQDGSDWGVYGRRILPDGTLAASEKLLNSTTTGSQVASSVTATNDGEYFVAWSSNEPVDGSEIVGQRLDASAESIGQELKINTTSDGEQREVQVVPTAEGEVFAVWKHGVPDGAGWEVIGRTIDETNSANEIEVLIPTVSNGLNSGHQEKPSVAINARNEVFAVWSGSGVFDSHGVHGQQLTLPFVANQRPDLQPILGQTATVGVEIVVEIQAIDPDPGDVLLFFLDVDDSPATATIEKTGDDRAVIRWTPTSADLPGPVFFRVFVSDALGEFDQESFEVVIG